MMASKRNVQHSYVLMLVAIAVFAVNFVAVLSYLNYRSMVIEMEENLIARVERETISSMEVALSFGKDFRNYYGIQDVFRTFEAQLKGPHTFILDADFKLLYETSGNTSATSEQVTRFLVDDSVRRAMKDAASQDSLKAALNERKAIFTPIHADKNIVGYFGGIYTNEIFSEGLRPIFMRVVIFDVIFSLIVCAALVGFIWLVHRESLVQKYGRINNALMRFLSVLLIELVILGISGTVMYSYQQDYRSRIEDSVRFSLRSISKTIMRVHEQGVDLSAVPDLKDYIERRVKSLEILHRTRITSNISDVMLTNENPRQMVFQLDTGDSNVSFYFEAEISERAMQRQRRETFFVLLSTMIILLIFIYELINLLKIFEIKDERTDAGFSEGQIALSLRFFSFLCCAGEYMCVPYAAMMIREGGEALFGLSVGMTAALPLTVESFTQFIATTIFPRVEKRISVRFVLIFSSVLMIACNVTTFIVGGALTIVACRALAGIAYAGTKRVSNLLITQGYETEIGRSNNIAQDSAGVVAGLTCGAGMGAIIASNGGYGITFLCSSVVFVFYFMSTLTMIPWKAIYDRKNSVCDLGARPVRIIDLAKILVSREVAFFSVVIAAPLFIGTMLCMTLIPAICQEQGISAVTLSYCYIVNGLSGIYVGPALVAKAKKYFGSYLPVAFVFGLTAFGIFIAKLPPVAMMVILTSLILGLMDGLATPIATDSFMSLDIVRNYVDESTALTFYNILSYLLMMAAPVAAELLLLPSNGIISPMAIGAFLYGLAAVVIVMSRMFTGHRKAAA